MRIWEKLDHVNVLPLLGYFTEGVNVMPALVSEWMEHGTLFDFMKSFPKASIATCTMVSTMRRSDITVKARLKGPANWDRRGFGIPSLGASTPPFGRFWLIAGSLANGIQY